MKTNILSSAHHAKLVPVPADQQQDSSLKKIGVSQPEGGDETSRLTRVKKNQTICANQVDTASTSFATEQENKLFAVRVVELVHQLLPFADGHAAVKPEVGISNSQSVTGRNSFTADLLFTAAELLEQVQCLCVIADQHYLVCRLGLDLMEESMESQHLHDEFDSMRRTSQAPRTSLPSRNARSGACSYCSPTDQHQQSLLGSNAQILAGPWANPEALGGYTAS